MAAAPRPPRTRSTASRTCWLAIRLVVGYSRNVSTSANARCSERIFVGASGMVAAIHICQTTQLHATATISACRTRPGQLLHVAVLADLLEDRHVQQRRVRCGRRGPVAGRVVDGDRGSGTVVGGT